MLIVGVERLDRVQQLEVAPLELLQEERLLRRGPAQPVHLPTKSQNVDEYDQCIEKGGA